ncbi:unnamed protein product [Lactuca virosa]|uniref:Uncharacterized protein n=1 Tax=Lactuca virosa TaxID=75947 RepID=A0AAU9MYX8_9ASTR|nr:unnamed protein product [Lactuca virosa]
MDFSFCIQNEIRFHIRNSQIEMILGIKKKTLNVHKYWGCDANGDNSCIRLTDSPLEANAKIQSNLDHNSPTRNRE